MAISKYNSMAKLTRKEVASLGGKAVYKKYGSSYMSKIGRLGFKAMLQKYELQPYSVNDWAIVDRATGKIVAYLSGKPVQSENQNDVHPF